MLKLGGCRAAGKPGLQRTKFNNTGKRVSMFKDFKPVSGCTHRCFAWSLSCLGTSGKDGLRSAVAGLWEPHVPQPSHRQPRHLLEQMPESLPLAKFKV